MPFKKVGENNYTSPSGHHFNSAQVRLYYANGGHFPGEKSYAGGGSVNKGYKGQVESFAAGGPVLGRTRDFIKEKDGEDQHMNEQYAPYKNPDMKSQEYEKGKSEANPKPKDKSLKAIKPRG